MKQIIKETQICIPNFIFVRIHHQNKTISLIRRKTSKWNGWNNFQKFELKVPFDVHEILPSSTGQIFFRDDTTSCVHYVNKGDFAYREKICIFRFVTCTDVITLVHRRKSEQGGNKRAWKLLQNQPLPLTEKYFWILKNFRSLCSLSSKFSKVAGKTFKAKWNCSHQQTFSKKVSAVHCFVLLRVQNRRRFFFTRLVWLILSRVSSSGRTEQHRPINWQNRRRTLIGYDGRENQKLFFCKKYKFFWQFSKTQNLAKSRHFKQFRTKSENFGFFQN